mgnify:CR=1
MTESILLMLSQYRLSSNLCGQEIGKASGGQVVSQYRLSSNLCGHFPLMLLRGEMIVSIPPQQ